ncbi:MAG: hypothetical protein DCE90_10050 [Pseudanabaena sp.]|nr:MAG: hypothetical protein DCE90_10050 [Pseudanabaena sp.]
MIQTLAKEENQYLVKWAVTWEQFKTLQSAFDEIGGVRMNYCEGELEISEWLPELDIEHLEQCLLMDSQLDAMTAFSEKYA